MPLPVRMLNEFTYCPRLFYLEFVDGLFRESADTLEGSAEHQAQDRPIRRREAPDDRPPPRTVAVSLADPGTGITGRLDVLEHADGVWYPVEFKHGSPPPPGYPRTDRLGPSGTWMTDEVQVCAQGLLLEASGMASPRGALWYRGTREQIVVDFTVGLRARTLEVVAAARALTRPGSTIPPPLEDDARCVRCSLAPICLPEETAALAAGHPPNTPLRRLVPADDRLGVLYVQTQGATVGKSGDVLTVRNRDERLGEMPMGQLRQVCLFGSVQVTTQAMHALLREDIPVVYFSGGGYFYGIAHGLPSKNIEWRRQQFLRFQNPETVLDLARSIMVGKIRNQRTLLRRNHRNLPDEVADRLTELGDAAGRANALQEMLGIEGAAARLYYEHFSGMLKGDITITDFQHRNRRPPRDPVNALLSLAYAVLAKDLTVAIYATGLDPMFGFYHQPRHGKPALALDLMEEFRPLIADSVVLSLINNRSVGPSDFISAGSIGACNLSPSGRATFFEAYERRKHQEVTHPLFGYRLSYGRMLELQARLMARYLTGEIPRYHPVVTR